MIPPASQAASTPPTSAIGSVRNSKTASRQLRNEAWSSSRMSSPAMIADSSSRLCAACRSWYSPSSSTWYPRASCTEPSFCLISLTTEPRSRPSTAAPTSRYLESPCRSMALGFGCSATVATSPSLMWPPDGRSIGRFSMSEKLCLVRSGLQTTTS